MLKKTLVSERYLQELDYSGKKKVGLTSICGYVSSVSLSVESTTEETSSGNTFKPKMDQVSLVAWRCES